MTLANTTNISEDGTADFNTSLNGSFVSDDYKTGVYLFGMIRDRDSYDRNGDGFLRMNLACPKTQVEDGLRWLKESVEAYQKRYAG